MKAIHSAQSLVPFAKLGYILILNTKAVRSLIVSKTCRHGNCALQEGLLKQLGDLDDHYDDMSAKRGKLEDYDG